MLVCCNYLLAKTTEYYSRFLIRSFFAYGLYIFYFECPANTDVLFMTIHYIPLTCNTFVRMQTGLKMMVVSLDSS